MKTFTFRKYIPTGRYRSFELASTDIKLGGRVCGYIKEQGGFHCKHGDNGKYTVSFAVKKEVTKKEPTPFRWVRLKARFRSEKEAREAIKKAGKRLQEKFDIHCFEE